MAKDKEAPKMETVKEGIRLSTLLNVEVCTPVKEQIDKIEICTPQIVTTCVPVRACAPYFGCLPIHFCKPDLLCWPVRMCKPDIFCSPLFIQEACGPSQIEMPTIPDYEQLVADVKALREEIAQLKRKVG